MTKEVTKDLEWKNIDHEIYRAYIFENGYGFKIKNPVLLNVSESGGHRIIDKEDVFHYIPKGWIHLFLETNDNSACWF